MIKIFSQAARTLTGKNIHINIMQLPRPKSYCAAILSQTKNGEFLPGYSQRIVDDARGWADLFIEKVRKNTSDQELVEKVAKFFDEII